MSMKQRWNTGSITSNYIILSKNDKYVSLQPIITLSTQIIICADNIKWTSSEITYKRIMSNCVGILSKF